MNLSKDISNINLLEKNNSLSNIQSSECEFFPICGGCDYLDLANDDYQKIKTNSLKKDLEVLTKFSDIFKFEDINFLWIGPKSRRKIVLQIDNKNNIGFFRKASKNLVKIDKCYVAEDDLSKIIPLLQNFLKDFESDLIKNISLTLFDNVVDVIFDCCREVNFKQSQKIITFAQSLKINISLRIKNKILPLLILQNPRIFLQNDVKLNLDSEIFIQATKKSLEEIIKIIRQEISSEFQRKIKIADIYSGFGVYSFAISDLAKEIHSFEGSENMISLIKKNSANSSAKIIACERDLIFYPLNKNEIDKFDLVIINPPRNGAGPQIDQIIKSKLRNLFYISCNPKSFAQEAVSIINSGFMIEKIFAIDQFHASKHLELIVIFKK